MFIYFLMRNNIIKSIFAALLMLMSMTANAQVQAFEKYSDTKGMSYVYVSKAMLSMAMNRMKPGSPAIGSVPNFDVKHIMNKLSGLHYIRDRSYWQEPEVRDHGYSQEWQVQPHDADGSWKREGENL